MRRRPPEGAESEGSRTDWLAAELGRVRQRGLSALDKSSHNQRPVKADSLELLAEQHCQRRGLNLHGRIAKIRVFLSDAVEAYGEQGNSSEAKLVSDLFFDPEDSKRDLPKKSAGQLLDAARAEHGPLDDEKFSDKRREVFGRFAAYLFSFVRQTADPDGSSIDPSAAFKSAPPTQHGPPRLEERSHDRHLSPPSLAEVMLVTLCVLAAVLAFWLSATAGVKSTITVGGIFVLTVMLSPFVASTVERIAASTLGLVWRSGADLRGRWRSTYKFASKGQQRAATQVMRLTQIGKVVYGRNIGGNSPHRHAIRMRLDGEYLTGVWKNSMPGARHHGVLQLRLMPNGVEMAGRWIGFDSEAKIQDGEWTWERM